MACVTVSWLNKLVNGMPQHRLQYGYPLAVSWSINEKQMASGPCKLEDMFNPNTHPGSSKERVRKTGNVRLEGVAVSQVSSAAVCGPTHPHVTNWT
jgi:hypothetical protein